jgi:hypothetical protein
MGGKRLGDFTGKVFGRLTVLHRSTQSGRPKWVCKCSCGTMTTVRSDHLRSGCTTSCGCLNLEHSAQRGLRHGLSGTPEYNTWSAMIARCESEGNPAWSWYGGRGIKVCPRWRRSVVAFYLDVGPRPEGHSLDRIDNNGNYEPGNVRWATHREQMRNTSRNKLITAHGKTKTQLDWARATGIDPALIHRRLKRGWKPGAAVNTPAAGIVRASWATAGLLGFSS